VIRHGGHGDGGERPDGYASRNVEVVEAVDDLPESLQVSFVLRFWLEAGEGAPSWRGRVIEMHEE
jgi:hypothetical protein